MIKVINNEVKAVKKQFSFYDFVNHEASSRQILIKFRDDLHVTRYDDISLGGNSREFNYQSNVLTNLIVQLLNHFNISTPLLLKYESRWIINKLKDPELVDLLRGSNIKINHSGGIETSNIDEIKKFIQSTFKYNSFIQLLDKNSQLIITPTDHMDIFIASPHVAGLFNQITSVVVNIDSEKLLEILTI